MLVQTNQVLLGTYKYYTFTTATDTSNIVRQVTFARAAREKRGYCAQTISATPIVGDVAL